MPFEFHQTGYGKKFFEYQLPMLIQALNRIADCMAEKRSEQPLYDLRHEPSMEMEGGSMKQYRLDIAEVHYGSALVSAVSKQQAQSMVQSLIEEGEVFWNKTEIGGVSVTYEP